MKFDDVLYLLRRGERLKRKDREGILIYVPPHTGTTAEGIIVTLAPDILVKYPNGALINWTPNVADILAIDWEVVPHDAA